MILQALSQLYERRLQSSDPGSRPPPAGFESKEIPFILEIDPSGTLIQIRDTRRVENKKKIARAELVPQGVKKTSGVASNLLWDTAEYVLGIDTRGKPDRVREQHAEFKKRIEELATLAGEDIGARAVLAFLARIDLAALQTRPEWSELNEANPLLTFRLHGDTDLVCQRPAIVAACAAKAVSNDADGLCLVTGEPAAIERLHTAIKGVWGAQTSGANIISFNLDAFNSYGKNQGANAPVGKQAANRYATALNDLLKRGSRQRIQIGDASTVFWAECGSALENDFGALFGEPTKDNPERNTDRVKALYESIRSGKYSEGRDQNERFYVLGLAPNAARLAVRFWHVDTIGGMAQRIARHFVDLDLVHAPHEPQFLSLFRLLSACAVQGKADNIPPNLGGDVMRAVFEDLPYPQTLLQAAVRRCRAEQDVSYPRAAVIKACLNRNIRFQRDPEPELPVSLDENRSSTAYRLGRLFATLEKIQEEANPGTNTTIRERYYGAASSAPVTVFTTLMRLKNHHVAKLDNRGRAVRFEQLIGQIISGITDFPAQFSIADQGLFAIGYYHQRQAFFAKADKSADSQGDVA
jgi:CRISPR-associated protein Csd1